MKDGTKSVLRFWGVAGVAYSLLVAAASGLLLPWKTPWVNVVFLAYAVLHMAAGIGMVRRTRLGHRLGVMAGGVGLLSCALVVGGLLASFFYLHGVFGDFGLGASIGALLFAGAGLQILGLYPALLLRALLARQVREDLGPGTAAIKVTAGILSAPILIGILLGAFSGADPVQPIPLEGRKQAVAYLRAALDGRSPIALDALDDVPVGEGPVYVTIWRNGRMAARVRGEGADMAEAVKDAASSLKTSGMNALEKREGVIKVDRVVAAATVPLDAGAVIALSVNPGMDGLRRANGDETRTVLPDDMMRANVFGDAPLVPGIRELRLGASPPWIEKRIGTAGDLERLRVESWMESEEGIVEVARGNVSPRSTGPVAWREAAVMGGDFILGQLRDDGRFHYIYRPMTDRHSSGGEYSLPRHSGTIYSLALLYGHTGEERFKGGAERAIAWLEERIPDRCGEDGMTCIAEGGRAWLGSTALTMVGMLEYQRRTGDRRYEETARKLAEFVLRMQRDDGDFDHLFLVEENRSDPVPRKMFFSEEAALALVMSHEVLGDDRYLDAAEVALDYLTGPKYDYFMGWFVYGADHWTCIAAQEAWPRLKSKQYLDFCEGYSRFMGRLQYEPGAWDNEDFTGHYGFGSLMVPQAPAAAGFTEAVISTFELSRQHGMEDPELRDQVALALDALARDQIREGNTYLMRKPEAAIGGIRRSLVEQEVRIDFTQHAASALIRGSAM